LRRFDLAAAVATALVTAVAATAAVAPPAPYQLGTLGGATSVAISLLSPDTKSLG